MPKSDERRAASSPERTSARFEKNCADGVEEVGEVVAEGGQRHAI